MITEKFSQGGVNLSKLKASENSLKTSSRGAGKRTSLVKQYPLREPIFFLMCSIYRKSLLRERYLYLAEIQQDTNLDRYHFARLTVILGLIEMDNQQEISLTQAEKAKNLLCPRLSILWKR